MLDNHVIQGRGLHNVVEGGQVTGFRFELRNPNYRSVAASLLDGIDVTVDGQHVPDHVPLWTLQGRTVDIEQLRASTDLRWELDEPATITVPLPGGLSAGVHEIEVVVHLRRPYFPPAIARSTFSASAKRVLVPAQAEGGIRLGVSTYSYSSDIYTLMTLEDVVADIADLGARGVEILAEGNIAGYPTPTTAWIDHWTSLVDRHDLVATNLGSWVDTDMWHDRSLTAEEGAAKLQTDLRLAKTLGFTSMRPKFGVTSWELDPHPIWQEAVKRSLDLAAELDVVICPEIHAPTPIKHRATQGYLDFIERTGTKHFQLLVDTGIFQTAPVLNSAEEIGIEAGEEIPAHLRPLAVPMSDLLEILPHVHFIQAKFFDVDDDLVDQHVPWPEIISTLTTAGWSGWLSSEYEGTREPYRGADQVRRQHALLRQLLSND